MRFRRILALVMAAVMAAAILPLSALAAGEETAAEAAQTAVQTELPAAEEAAPLTQEERSAELTELLEFADRLKAMEQEHALRAEPDPDDPFTAARLIVRSEAPVDFKGSVAHVSGWNGWHVVQYASPEAARKAYAEYSELRGVEYVVPDQVMTVPRNETKCTAPVKDGQFLSWGYGAGYADAGNYQQWLLGQYENGAEDMPEILVGVIDSGVDELGNLEGRIAGYNDFVRPRDEGADLLADRHGTWVAQTVVDGTLPNVKILNLRVINADGFANTSDILMAIEYAALNGCRVANLSLGGYRFDDTYEAFKTAASYARSRGTALVAAAGNDSQSTEDYCPASVPGFFTVAAHDNSLDLADFSNYGPSVDIMAAGVNTFVGSGTSFSAPHVSAAFALLFSRDNEMTVAAAEAALKHAAINTGLVNCGAGILNMTDLFVYDPYIVSDLHFVSECGHPWEALDGVGLASAAVAAGSVSSLTGRGYFSAYEQLTVEYRLEGADGDGEFRVSVDGEPLFSTQTAGEWQSFSAVVPGAGAKTLTFEYESLTGSPDARVIIKRTARRATISTCISGSNLPLFFENPAVYPWHIADGSSVQSGNAACAGTTSEITATAELKAGDRFRFLYQPRCSAETSSRFTFLVNGEEMLASSEYMQWFEEYGYLVPSDGEYTFTFRFYCGGYANDYVLITAAPTWEDTGTSYDIEEFMRLRDFLETRDGSGATNGSKVNPDGYNANNPLTWNVVWSEYDHSFNVSEIGWSLSEIAGELDISGFRKLERIDISNTSIDSLNVSGCVKLRDLIASNSQLASITWGSDSVFAYLRILWINNTNLGGSLDLTFAPFIEFVGIEHCRFTSLNCTDCHFLKLLWVEGNRLTEVRLSGCYQLLGKEAGPSVYALEFTRMPLAVLEVSDCKQLQILNCAQTELSEIDLSGCERLLILNLNETHVTELDLSDCGNLTWLLCDNPFGPYLTRLELASATPLENISCGHARLPGIDLSGHNGIGLDSVTISGNGFIGFTAGRSSGQLYAYPEEGSSFRGWYNQEGELLCRSWSFEDYNTEEDGADIIAQFYDPALAPSSISVQQIEVDVDLTQPIVFSVEPITANDSSVWFESLNHDVAVVEHVLMPGSVSDYYYCVRGVSAGTTTLIARSTLDDSLYATASITVTNPVPDEIIAEDLYIEVGTTQQLSVSLLPADIEGVRLIYRSADKSVARVDETGLVEAVAAGETTITVTCAGDPTVFATATVTVHETLPQTIVLDSIAVEAGWYRNASYMVLPTNAYNQEVTFEIADTSIATVDQNGEVFGVSVGTTELTVRCVADPTVFATVPITVITPESDCVALKVTSAQAACGECVTVDVVISGTYALNALTFSVNWPEQLMFTGRIIKGPVWTELESLGSVIVNDSMNEGMSIGFMAVVPNETFSVEGVIMSLEFYSEEDGEWGVSPSIIDCFSMPDDETVVEVRNRAIEGWIDVYIESVLRGDVDLDGEVTVADALLVMRYVLSIIELDSEQYYNADFYQDDIVDTVDAILIMRYCLSM